MTRKAAASRAGVTRSISVPKSWLWLPAAGMVIVAAGAVGILGYRQAGSPEGLLTAKGEGRSSINAQMAPGAARDTHRTPTPAGSVADQQGQASKESPSLNELLQKLAAAMTPEAKRAAADALILFGSEEALSAWGEALMKEKDPALRKAMMEALDNLNGEAAVEMITQLIELYDAPEVFDGVARTLSRMATAETPKYLAEIYTGATPGDARQERALRMLGAIANPSAVPGLIQVAHQPELGSDVTGQAFLSLGKIGNSAALVALSGAFNTLSPDNFAQRQQVVAAIAAISNPESRTMLEDLSMNSEQPLIANAAAEALKNLPAANGNAPAQSAADLPPAFELLAKQAPVQ